MVTNINLAAPERQNKINLSGKASLVLSVLLLVVVVGVYAVIVFISSRTLNQEKQIESQIQAESAKISGPEFAEMADFQDRLSLIDKILGDHIYFDGYVKNFSKYILPEVRLTSLGWKDDGSEISVSGTAPNFDALSRELILLKNSPIVQSVEFNSATEAKGQEGQSGVTFSLMAKIKKEALNK
ncbi:MAG: PilN domain-containing protein [Candidatus Moranbacteria bacterium]|nr:PilN domain-containing protein [Candidatus Moranbacteria bacterium]